MHIEKRLDAHIPEWAVTYLEYGEVDNLSAEDIAEVDAWVESLHRQGFTSPIYEWDWENPENGFYHYPEFGLGAECIMCHVLQLAN